MHAQTVLVVGVGYLHADAILQPACLARRIVPSERVACSLLFEALEIPGPQTRQEALTPIEQVRAQLGEREAEDLEASQWQGQDDRP